MNQDDFMEQENKFLKFLGFMWNPLSWVMEIAALMAIVMANGGVNFLFLPHSTYLLAYFQQPYWGKISNILAWIVYDLIMQGEPPDWQDFVGIVALLLINSTISFVEENNAGNAAAALMAGLAPKTKVPWVV